MNLAAAMLWLALSSGGGEDRAAELSPPPILVPADTPAVQPTDERTWRKQRMFGLLLEKDALVSDRPTQLLPAGMILLSLAAGGGSVALFANDATRRTETMLLGVLTAIIHLGLGILGPALAVQRGKKQRETDARVATIDAEVSRLMRPPPSLIPIQVLQ